MVRALGILGIAAMPYLLGAAIGFGAAVLGLRRWLARAGEVPTADITPILRHVGLRYLAGGLVVTVGVANCLAHQLSGETDPAIVQHSLLGFALGLFFGTRWVFRRGGR